MTDADASAPADVAKAALAAPRWEAYALALGRVVRAMGCPDVTAAEWLRQQALAGTVRVRFAPHWLQQHNTNRHRAAMLPVYQAQGIYGEGFSDCYWYWPSDFFTNLGPAARNHEDVQSTDWEVGDLTTALQTTAEGDAEHTAGRKPDWPWAEIVAEVAIAFALGGGRDKAEVVTAMVQDVAQRMADGHRPSRSRAQPFARAIRSAWERRAGSARK